MYLKFIIIIQFIILLTFYRDKKININEFRETLDIIQYKIYLVK